MAGIICLFVNTVIFVESGDKGFSLSTLSTVSLPYFFNWMPAPRGCLQAKTQTPAIIVIIAKVIKKQLVKSNFTG